MVRPRQARLALPAHVHRTVSGGREYFAYHSHRGSSQPGVRVSLPGAPQNADGSLNHDWWTKYHQLAGTAVLARGTFALLIQAYQSSPEWASMAQSTRSDWSRYLSYVEKVWGHTRVDGFKPRHVLELRDAYADIAPAPPGVLTKPRSEYAVRPAAANNLLRSLSAMIAWSIPRGWRDDNPCDHVPKLPSGDGYSPWSWEDIALFRQVASPRFVHAQALALYTGQRQGDVLGMLWTRIRDNMISVRQEKTNTQLWIPMHRDLARIVAEMKRTSVTMVSNSAGSPWTKHGFKASWQKQMADNRLAPLRKRHLVFHGLRKSSVVFLLEAGCTDAEVASITGQSREMVEHYAKQVNQRRLAASAILKWETVETARADLRSVNE